MKPSPDEKVHYSSITLELETQGCSLVRERPLAINTVNYIENPGLARFNYAPSVEHPQGSKAYSHERRHQTVLQQHVTFWDRDEDGIIYPSDIFRGFRDLGFNVLVSTIAILISVFFSYPTRLKNHWLPDPYLRISVDSIHKAKHGSDSGIFDTEGRFIPQNFENLFSKYDTEGNGKLSAKDLFNFMRGSRCAMDPFGWISVFFEWGTTWLLMQQNGYLYKEDIRQLLDGSLFWHIREQNLNGTGWKQGGDFIGFIREAIRSIIKE